jgi:NAD-dependent SIR2 family protein deacetylase
MKDGATIQAAAKAIAQGEALLIGAGAGMGVDSGLPDFRGTEGFWNAYPPYRELGLRFIDLANPRWFRRDPTLAWGFYGHRLQLYRDAMPHGGFRILQSWAQRMKLGAFIFTSNVDEQFQKAGFSSDSVCEVHGSLQWLQCTRRCGRPVFPADNLEIRIDEDSMHAVPPLPKCPGCGQLARPNVLMFGDWDWDEARTAKQNRRLEHWLETIRGKRLVVVECGAGTALPTVRHFCETCASFFIATLIRINPREPEVPSGQLGIGFGARAALQAIDEHLRAMS